MVIASLSLDDVLENSPQTQCLLKVFEEDVSSLWTFATQLQSHLELFVAAQSDVAASLEQLATFLSTYDHAKFPLDRGNTDVGETVKKFQGTISELGTWFELMVQQMQNCVMYPVNKLLDRINESRRCKVEYYDALQNSNMAAMKLLRLSRKEPQKKLEDANAEYGSMKRYFHKSGLRYFVLLNALQYQRRIGIVEPLLSIIYAYRSLFRMGDQALSQQDDLCHFFTRVQDNLHRFHVEQQSDATKSQEYVQSIEELARAQPHYYEMDADDCASPSSAERWSDQLRHKQGYLFFKSRSGLLNKWDQYYFYTENNSLLCQGKDDIGSQVLLELDQSVHAVEADQEDRRYCLTVICSDKNKQLCLQANSAKDCREWISAINNIVASVVRHSSHSSSNPSANKPGGVVVEGQQRDTDSGDVAADQWSTEKDEPEEDDDFSSAPIQFDLFPSGDEPNSANGLTSAVVDEQSSPTAAVGEFGAKFLGCVEVNTDRSEPKIQKAIRRVTRARMLHNIVRAVDAKIVVRKKLAELRLLDPNTSCLKAVYQMDQIVHWTVDQSHERMFAFVVRQKTDRGVGQRCQYVCHVFESTGVETAEEICDVLGEAVRSALQTVA